MIDDHQRNLAGFLMRLFMEGAEGGAADVDGVGAVQDGLAADLGDFGLGQQFELVV